jgi:hypothetical protein
MPGKNPTWRDSDGQPTQMRLLINLEPDAQ